MQRVLTLAVVMLLAFPFSGTAQQAAPRDEFREILDQIKSQKKELIARNLNLSETEAKAFWPIYEDYQADLRDLNGRYAVLIADYADAYGKQTVSDEQAATLISEMLEIEADELAMRKRHAAKLEGAVSGRTAVRYLQLENKIRAAIQYQLADRIPLMK